MNKFVDKLAKVLVAVGAFNWGLAVFNVNLLSYVPAGMWLTIVELAIGASGAYVGYEIYKKRI